jgi:soluble lytic murein transglycosylase-like protein
LAGEILLFISFLCAWGITAWMKRDEPPVGSSTFQAGFGPLYQNYRILQYFLNGAVEKIGEPIDGTAAPNPMIDEIKSVRDCQDLLDAGGFDEALALLRIPASSYPFLTRKKNALLLTCLYRKKNYREFIGKFDSLRPDSRELAIFRIHCLWNLGRKNEALAQFRESFAGHSLQSLRGLVPSFVWKSLIRRLDNAFWFNQYLELTGKSDPGELLAESIYVPDPQMSLLYRADSLFQTKRYAEAEKTASRIRSPKFFLYRERLMFKIHLRMDPDFDPGKAIEAFRLYPAFYRELLLESGNIQLVMGKYSESLQRYEAFLSLGGEGNESYWKTVWQTAWIYYRQNLKTKALAFFQRGSRSPFLAYRIPCQYWRARIDNRYNPELAEFPFTYYTVKLFNDKSFYRELNQKYIQTLNGPISAPVAETIRLLKILYGFRFYEECLQLIRWTKSLPRLNEIDRNMLATIESILWNRQNQYQMAFRKFKENYESYQSIRLPNFLSQIYFPIQYQDVIFKQCRSLAVDPHLVMALIREESFFRPDAVSRAKAYGLMQLLFETARRHTQTKRFDRRDLLNPHTNIILGIAYLRALLDRFDGKAYLALAAYNAGENRVDQWLSEFPNAAEDEFIEMIPFSETRNYVKNVLLSRFFYRYYYEGTPTDSTNGKQVSRSIEPRPIS